jgi:hypothetical protein
MILKHLEMLVSLHPAITVDIRQDASGLEEMLARLKERDVSQKPGLMAEVAKEGILLRTQATKSVGLAYIHAKLQLKRQFL